MYTIAKTAVQEVRRRSEHAWAAFDAAAAAAAAVQSVQSVL
jgi:hypothetical protein